MVQEGWALAYRRYSSQYVKEEGEARAAGTGVWHSQFVEPWEWRKQSRAAHEQHP
jgi:endonuclease YncB( thermonuclease family)